ncbi:hypothetical protein JCM18920_3218 [Cutibacterium acnes JCM 18920]|nr:hypothetical protein JCM18920_3218 [Cutibacterium acnes JCM 18920]
MLDSTTIGLAPVRTRMAREFLDAGPDVAGEVAAARAGGPGSFGCSCVTPLTRRREPQNRR